jgi:hypothetical protein
MAVVALLAATGCSARAAVHAVSSDRIVGGTALAGAERFTDPQGTYTLQVDPAWATLPGAFVKEVEAWSIGIVDDGFTANVNVLTQETTVDDLEAYIDLSLNSMGSFVLVTNDVFTDTDGHRLGEIEFTGVVPMSGIDRPLHFLTYFDFKDGQAVVVTLSTSEATFAQAREQAEPYLRTLRET